MRRFKQIANYCLLIQLMTITVLCQDWEVQSTNTKASIRSICFLDSLNGWAITDSIIFLHTTNGGNDWIIEKIQNEKFGIQQIQFVTKGIGYACASQGRLFSTKDGGKTWIRYAGNFEIDFQDLSFVNENEGWAAGQRYGDNFGRGMIVHTSDGGNSWQKQLEIESTDRFGVKFFKAIRMKNNKEGWAIAGDYFDNFSLTYVYKTDDGGENWNKLSSHIEGPARRLKIANSDTLWADGYGVAPLSTTTNGGLSWDTYFNEYRYIKTISPQSGNKGWVCYTDFRKVSPHYVLYTTDRGISWVKEFQVNENVTDMENNGNYVWLSGGNGLIMRKKLVTTSIDESASEIPLDYTLSQNYPNPFNPETTMEFTIPVVDANFASTTNHVTLKVYDVLGREVATLVDEYKQPGNYKVTFNARHLSTPLEMTSGVYFYQLRAGSFVKTKKLVLMK
ncbi:MAG: hypothetical protein A2499_14830 [Stygiobacter sp. RIFOXYC12_FULL_38_8]|nr:MAG: hypothetical protein A2237_18205 [Stygiobacter sp. RIFOXYA2_FULL_38_8]OGV12851.1 MAG: hypothetical protein A2440_16585 [Stygiobacter sp. RIFOXYC2_FULL_38_25]OGV27108.1 MAG: hypothetical protein A2499_14830 [Stygiobacter sp. RIFOXYC12_FULL_38_8]OGV81892.1 MAG: hypothetical protein A2X65_13665 [Stygiobacter sp. GWF2_38_21]OGV85377.1 MAG: hypothetical protein A3J88_03960 [Melioribacter sp. RIFOXYB12_FULL_38_5]